MAIVNLREPKGDDFPLTHIKLPPRRLRLLRQDVVDGLAESMSKIGLLQPILAAEEDGLLIAGLHRYEAAKKLGWRTIRTVLVEGRSVDLMRIMQIDENLVRADLSPAERAAHQHERKKLYESEFPETRQGGAPAARGPGRGGKIAKTSGIPSFAADAATKTGVSRRTVERDVERAQKIPDVLSVAGTALDTPDELDALVKLPKAKQRELIGRAKGGHKVSAKTTLKQVKREEREAELAKRTELASQAIGHRRYGVLYADPPWRFEPYSRETGLNRAADNHYPTMTLDEIKRLQVPAAKDCVLFLWATAPMLCEALEVLRAWGFAYKSHCIWAKPRKGTGFWFRNAHELLLVGTRGNVAAPAPGHQPLSVIEAAATRHSKKPEAFAEMIERLFPRTGKLEMFARQSRLGWHAWGNEVVEEAAE